MGPHTKDHLNPKSMQKNGLLDYSRFLDHSSTYFSGLRHKILQSVILGVPYLWTLPVTVWGGKWVQGMKKYMKNAEAEMEAEP